MKYFSVQECVMTDGYNTEEILSDGSTIAGSRVKYTTREFFGYKVYEFDEAGWGTGEKMYYGSEADKEKLLDQIKADYPAGEWQNNQW